MKKRPYEGKDCHSHLVCIPKTNGGNSGISARVLMEMAIDVMTKTVNEPHKDGYVSPCVGVVIHKPDGTIETAYRGEFHHGDHAEYTLLKKKNRSNQLDNSILFTTLEPCAPGALPFLERSCAELIVDAMIKEVWIGIEDPDHRINCKGIKYLRENGVTVHMFDSDLQDIIGHYNREFITQALQKAKRTYQVENLVGNIIKERIECSTVQ